MSQSFFARKEQMLKIGEVVEVCKFQNVVVYEARVRVVGGEEANGVWIKCLSVYTTSFLVIIF